jgi:hypothetical protein
MKLKTLAITATILSAQYASASTLAFTGGGGNNADIGATYGTDIAANSTEFVTTDGSGTTPNIALAWIQNSLPSNDAIWEFHNGWSGSLDGTAAQMDLDSPQTVTAPTIDFTPDAGFGVVLNSVDIGMYTSVGAGTIAWTVNVERVSDNVNVFTHTTAALGANASESVDIDFTGDLGVAYRLEFAGGGGSFEGAIDNLSFSQTTVQIPEPSSTALIGLGGLALILRRRR